MSQIADDFTWDPAQGIRFGAQNNQRATFVTTAKPLASAKSTAVKIKPGPALSNSQPSRRTLPALPFEHKTPGYKILPRPRIRSKTKTSLLPPQHIQFCDLDDVGDSDYSPKMPVLADFYDEEPRHPQKPQTPSTIPQEDPLLLENRRALMLERRKAIRSERRQALKDQQAAEAQDVKKKHTLSIERQERFSDRVTDEILSGSQSTPSSIDVDRADDIGNDESSSVEDLIYMHTIFDTAIATLQESHRSSADIPSASDAGRRCLPKNEESKEITPPNESRPFARLVIKYKDKRRQFDNMRNVFIAFREDLTDILKGIPQLEEPLEMIYPGGFQLWLDDFQRLCHDQRRYTYLGMLLERNHACWRYEAGCQFLKDPLKEWLWTGYEMQGRGATSTITFLEGLLKNSLVIPLAHQDHRRQKIESITLTIKNMLRLMHKLASVLSDAGHYHSIFVDIARGDGSLVEAERRSRLQPLWAYLSTMGAVQKKFRELDTHQRTKKFRMMFYVYLTSNDEILSLARDLEECMWQSISEQDRGDRTDHIDPIGSMLVDVRPSPAHKLPDTPWNVTKNPQMIGSILEESCPAHGTWKRGELEQTMGTDVSETRQTVEARHVNPRSGRRKSQPAILQTAQDVTDKDVTPAQGQYSDMKAQPNMERAASFSHICESIEQSLAASSESALAMRQCIFDADGLQDSKVKTPTINRKLEPVAARQVNLSGYAERRMVKLQPAGQSVDFATQLPTRTITDEEASSHSRKTGISIEQTGKRGHRPQCTTTKVNPADKRANASKQREPLISNQQPQYETRRIESSKGVVGGKRDFTLTKMGVEDGICDQQTERKQRSDNRQPRLRIRKIASDNGGVNIMEKQIEFLNGHDSTIIETGVGNEILEQMNQNNFLDDQKPRSTITRALPKNQGVDLLEPRNTSSGDFCSSATMMDAGFGLWKQPQEFKPSPYGYQDSQSDSSSQNHARVPELDKQRPNEGSARSFGQENRGVPSVAFKPTLRFNSPFPVRLSRPCVWNNRILEAQNSWEEACPIGKPNEAASAENFQGSIDVGERDFLAHIPLSYQIPEAVKREKMLASLNTGAAFWSFDLYRGPQGQKIKVHYCKSWETTERVAQHFLNQTVLGFDIEWKPQATVKDGIKGNVSLIQLACEDRIALFHLARYQNCESINDFVAPTLKRIMESPNITKVGVGIKGDCTRLRKFLEIDSQGTFELSHLYNLISFGAEDQQRITKRLVALARQVEKHLQLPLWKGEVRSSDWSKELKMQQVLYAASDSYAGLHLFDVMEGKRKSLDPAPPRPAHAELNLPIRLADAIAVSALDEQQELNDLGDDDLAETPDIETMAREFLDLAIEGSRNPDNTTNTTYLPDHSARPSKSAKTNPEPKPPKPSQVILAEEWVATWRSSLSIDYKPRATPACLRAYALWHEQCHTVSDIAALLRDPPLQKATVASYILESIRLEKFAYRNERIDDVLNLVPAALRNGKFRHIRQGGL